MLIYKDARSKMTSIAVVYSIIGTAENKDISKSIYSSQLRGWDVA